jgi:uncharacterized repeat protein (TIGR04052 family)
MHSWHASLSLILCAVLLSSSCGPGDTDQDDPTQSLTVHAVVGDENFSCQSTYEGLGLSESTVAFRDLRLYVHDLQAIDEAGHAHDLEVPDDGKWQYDGIVLLDFTDGSCHCANTSSVSNQKIEFRLPRRSPQGYHWRGLAMAIGVPVDHNHRDMSTAPAPLNMPAMFWSWNAGYKFLRLDMAVDDDDTHRLHLGSTKCAADDPDRGERCQYPNRIPVAVDQLDFDDLHLRFDLATLVAETDLSDGAAGCMSEGDDPDCAGFFEVLGVNDELYGADSSLFSPGGPP